MTGRAAGWDDTIVALAAPGIRCDRCDRAEWKMAWEIANNLFPGKDLLRQATHTLHIGLSEKRYSAGRGSGGIVPKGLNRILVKM